MTQVSTGDPYNDLTYFLLALAVHQRDATGQLLYLILKETNVIVFGGHLTRQLTNGCMQAVSRKQKEQQIHHRWGTAFAAKGNKKPTNWWGRQNAAPLNFDPKPFGGGILDRFPEVLWGGAVVPNNRVKFGDPRATNWWERHLRQFFFRTSIKKS